MAVFDYWSFPQYTYLLQFTPRIANSIFRKSCHRNWLYPTKSNCPIHVLPEIAISREGPSRKHIGQDLSSVINNSFSVYWKCENLIQIHAFLKKVLYIDSFGLSLHTPRIKSEFVFVYFPCKVMPNTLWRQISANIYN